jgi:putative heme-binding domain-containing protein
MLRLLIGVLVLTALPAWAQQDHPGQYTAADVQEGARVYATQCAQCHGLNGDMVSGVDLRRGQFRRAASDEDLARVVSGGIPGAGMPPFALQGAELTGVIAYIRAGFDRAGTAVRVGNPERGRALFEGKGNCTSCHRAAGRGPRVAPDLTDIGLARSPAALHRTLLDPSAAMLPINRPVRIVMRDGRTFGGRRLNEDTYSVQIIDSNERLLSLEKKDIRTLEVSVRSPMPSYAQTLSPEELSDLIAHLLTLKD